MFGFLKNKIKSALSSIKKEVIEEEGIDEAQLLEQQTQEKQNKTKQNKEKTQTKKQKEKQEKQKKEEKQNKKQREQKEDKEQQKKTEKTKEQRDKTKKQQENKEDKEEKKQIEEIKSKKQTQEEQSKQEDKKDELEETDKENQPKKKGFFSKFKEKFTKPILKKKLSEEQFEKIFWELELGMIEANVALEVIEKIKEDLRKDLVEKEFNMFNIDKEIEKSFNKSIKEILDFDVPNLIEKVDSFNKKPVVICFFGINGSGKTTTIAKIAKLLKDNGKSVVIAASDTFRAAAIHQLEEHANNVGIKVIKHNYGADAAAVAFDAIEHAKAHNIDIVLIDTAGRSHSNANLMDELAKIIRVAKPDLKIFVGDSLTGNDMVEQAKIYDEKIGVDGLILTKTDADEKGGAIISATYITQKPIYFLGMGQNYEDLVKFDKELILEKIGLNQEG